MAKFRPPPKVPPTGRLGEDALGAHSHSIDHRGEVTASSVCGCFHCLATFPPGEILQWTDEVDGVQVTALCPKCGVDAVVGSASGYEVDAALLIAMRLAWFHTL